MRKFLLLAIGCVIIGEVHAQFVARSSQPFQLAASYNPAFSGIEDFGDLKIAYRYQWTGYSDAPNFAYVAFNGRLRRPTELNDQALRVSKMAQQQINAMPNSRRIIMGWGAQAFSESAGPTKHVGGQLNYAMHYPLSKKTHFSVGVSVVLDNTSLSLSEITLGEANDPFYDFLLSKGSSYTNLSARAGFLLYGERFYFGGSYLPLFDKTIRESGLNDEHDFYTATFMGGIVLGNTEELSVRPSIFGLLDRSSEVAIDYSAKMYLRNKFWWGVTYRDVKSLVIMLGMQVNPTLGFGYSYERSVGGLGQFTSGSHDLVVNVRIKNYRKLSPYTW